METLIELPESCQVLWKWFVRLHSTRTSNGFNADPLQYSEMLAFFQLLSVEPEEWELDTIRRLDNCVLEMYAKRAEKDAAKSRSKSKK